MQALVLTRHDAHFGGLDLVAVDEPRPRRGEVAIDVQFAGIGLIDALWAAGMMPSTTGFTPGLEVAGTVREVGDGVTKVDVGQRVAAVLPAAGGFAEIVCASGALVAPIPVDLATDLAAVVPVNTVTAHLALTTIARLAPGASVLVHAGVGGLGSQFGQVARALGAGQVDAVVGTPEKQASAHRLGYDRVFFRDELRDVPERSYDVVVDPVGGEATTTGLRSLRSGGQLLRVGNASQAPDVTISSSALWLENKTVAGFNVGASLAKHPEQGTASLEWSLEAVARGDVRVELTRIGDLGDIAELLALLSSGNTTGKLALQLRTASRVNPQLCGPSPSRTALPR